MLKTDASGCVSMPHFLAGLVPDGSLNGEDNIGRLGRSWLQGEGAKRGGWGHWALMHEGFLPNENVARQDHTPSLEYLPLYLTTDVHSGKDAQSSNLRGKDDVVLVTARFPTSTRYSALHKGCQNMIFFGVRERHTKLYCVDSRSPKSSKIRSSSTTYFIAIFYT
ncbi:hypothetical protein VTO42DRAFT_5710 [Malbranchea cinnamomea]